MTSAARRVYERRGRLVRDGWYSYAERVLPKDAPAVQRQETRRAFYAGAFELLLRLAELGEDEISEDATGEGPRGRAALRAGVEVLEATKRDSEQFVKTVGTPSEGR